MKTRTLFLIIIILLIGIGILLLFLNINLSPDAERCLADPINYYISKTNSSCFCGEDMFKFLG